MSRFGVQYVVKVEPVEYSGAVPYDVFYNGNHQTRRHIQQNFTLTNSAVRPRGPPTQ
jgi:hypothetical protein